MVELLRFQNLRPVQWMPDEFLRRTGLSLYPDDELSPFALSLRAADDRRAHDALIARFREQNHASLIDGPDELNPVIRSLYEWLDFKSRPITPRDLEEFVESLDARELTDFEGEWERAADNLILAIHANLLSKNHCVDFQLVIRIFHLIRRALEESDGGYELAKDVTPELIEKLLGQAILLTPGAIFGRCFRRCRDENHLRLPAASREKGRDKEGRLSCECKCDESCKEPADHCICVRPYIGDLFLIREELARYEAGEIADIENVLAGEEKVRRHRMLTRSEETLELSNETEVSNERDHGVTEKVSLQSEVKSTVEQKTNLDAGVTATFKYGEAITVTPHANVTASWGRSQSRSVARSYAKDVVDRSVSKLQEKTRRVQITKTIREVEERNKHAISNNDPGAVHRAGLYFWVNKVTHAQVMNYGRHMMFDLILPEPAAIYRSLFAKKQAQDDQRVEPQKPEITPALVKRDTYGSLLAKYGLASTEELQPPEREVAVQWAFSANVPKPEGGNAVAFSSHEIKSPDIPTGYGAKSISYDVRCSIGHPQSTDPKDEVAVSVHVADTCIFARSMNEYLSGGGQPSHDWVVTGQHGMKGEQGNVTVALAGFSSLALSLGGSLTIIAELSTEAFEKWQVTIFNAIMADYVRKLDAFNESKDARAGLFEIKGRNPFLNREIERNEIKRHVIGVLMCNYFNGIGSMMERVAPCGYPEIDFAKLERDAPVIQFFEQVFEWEHLTYLFYHSMWARKCKWDVLIDENSGDPLFDKFLTAGAARVQVPVRPGLEKVFAWFLATGQIWGATGLPPLPGEAEYVGMIQELKEARQGDYDERPGLIEATQGSNVLELTDSTFYWDEVTSSVDQAAIENDRDRELLLDYKVHRIVSVEQASAGDETRWNLTVAEPYDGASASNLKHAVGAVFVGAPWEVVIPTQLVYLRNPTDGLPTYPLV